MICVAGINRKPRIAFISGADYSNSLTTSLAERIHGTGRFKASLILRPGASDRPSDSNIDSRELLQTNTLTRLKLRPRSVNDLRDLVPGITRAIGRALLRSVFRSCDYTNLSLVEDFQSTCLTGQISALLKGIEIANWQCAAPSCLRPFLHIPEPTKTVLSFWGSDLLRSDGIASYAIQKVACERANLITVCSVELSEIVQAKFGRFLSDKIRIARYGSNILDLIDAERARRQEFRRRHNFRSEDKLICVGANGAASNRHCEVIEQIGMLDAHHKRDIVAVLPMSYGLVGDYVGKVKSAIARAGIRAHILREKLDATEMAQLRLGTDMMVYMPLSDALSASVSETLYAGGILVAGAWLPYGPWRRAGLRFHEIERLDGLAESLARILDNFEEEKRIGESQYHLAGHLARWDCVTTSWLDVYRELISVGE